MANRIHIGGFTFAGRESHSTATPVKWKRAHCNRCGATLQFDADQPARLLLDHLWDHLHACRGIIDTPP